LQAENHAQFHSVLGDMVPHVLEPRESKPEGIHHPDYGFLLWKVVVFEWLYGFPLRSFSSSGPNLGRRYGLSVGK
jgi:hypothetical protein